MGGDNDYCSTVYDREHLNLNIWIFSSNVSYFLLIVSMLIKVLPHSGINFIAIMSCHFQCQSSLCKHQHEIVFINSNGGTTTCSVNRRGTLS